MKIKDLKKRKWIAHFNEFDGNEDAYIAWNGETLQGDGQAEYDNGLYLDYSRYRFEPTWKDIKHFFQSLKTKFNKSWYSYNFTFYTGKCKRCGKAMSWLEFLNMGMDICAKCESKYWANLFDVPDEDIENEC